jgi:alpha-L-fucosidase
MTYAPTLESIRHHVAPEWFHDAKLGIFIHWGLYSLPGWAPTTGSLPEVLASTGWRGWFARNPYAEWYLNSIRLPGSPSAAYHAATYGADFAYEQFAPLFNAAAAAWDPADWAALFAAAGARYVVLTTKHHDGFLLWPSAYPNPFKPGYQTERDVVGELMAAVRAHGLQMGLYYSGGLDWTFDDHVIADIGDLFRAIPQGPEYVAYADAHIRELIDRYAPSVLWNDIGYPAAANLPALFAYYYNSVPAGAVNDRFSQVDPAALATEPAAGGPVVPPQPAHFDFRTPEYTSYGEIRSEKWETCRGLGYSFGYNRNEAPEDRLTATEVIRLFVDIVSKNGNLLLNVGPRGDGTIPAEQRERLLTLGQWLVVNGPAIYATRPWVTAEGHTAEGIPVRFTQSPEAVYALLLGTPRGHQVAIESLVLDDEATVALLGHEDPLPWARAGQSVVVTLPDRLADAPAHALRLAPKPQPVA